LLSLLQYGCLAYSKFPNQIAKGTRDDIDPFSKVLLVMIDSNRSKLNKLNKEVRLFSRHTLIALTVAMVPARPVQILQQRKSGNIWSGCEESIGL
jgi:hypothetical protein